MAGVGCQINVKHTDAGVGWHIHFREPFHGWDANFRGTWLGWDAKQIEGRSMGIIAYEF